MKILLASRNRDKGEEFRGLLRGLPVEILTLEAFPDVGPVEEDAPTLEGNALKKAREVFRQTGIPALADDTGLEVPYLNDAPGVYSSRFAGPSATYADNVAGAGLGFARCWHSSPRLGSTSLPKESSTASFSRRPAGRGDSGTIRCFFPAGTPGRMRRWTRRRRTG